MKKCICRLFGSLGFGVGILIALMYIHNVPVADTANWSVLAYGLIGLAVGVLVAIIVCKACCSSKCGTGE